MDLCFHRSKVAPQVKVAELTDLSDHVPVTADLKYSDTDDDLRIPLSLVESPELRGRLAREFMLSGPRCLTTIKEAKTWGEAERS